MRFPIVLLVALLAAPVAAALPLEWQAGPLLERAPEMPPGKASCVVASLDRPGTDVEPFIDAAAVGAQIGTAAATTTVAVYPYSCSYIVLQAADPNRPVPRGDLLPEDTPLRETWDPLLP